MSFFYEQTPQNALSVSQLKSYAGAIGLNQKVFDSCLDSGKYRDYVTHDQRAAVAAGARGTLGFFVNGQAAFPSYDGMAGAIEQVLVN